jgi:hypothetical protein
MVTPDYLSPIMPVRTPLDDPKFDVFSEGRRVGGNDNWGGTAALSAAFASVGAFALPGDSRDAALACSVLPGSHTVVVSDGSGATGRILVEVYELP